MKRVLKTAAFLIGAMFFVGGACPSNDTTLSSKVDQSEIYQIYRVAESGENYEATVYFRLGGKTGTTLSLASPSSITLNGQPLQEHLNTLSGTFYTATIPKTATSIVFVFNDVNSKAYTNTLDLSRVGLATKNVRVNGTLPFSIALEGTPPRSTNFALDVNGRTVFVDPGQMELSEAYFVPERNSIIVLPMSWKKAESGNVTVRLNVTTLNAVQQGALLGGEITYSYSTPPVNFVVSKANSITGRATDNTNLSANKK
jgi:hypothetical protein